MNRICKLAFSALVVFISLGFEIIEEVTLKGDRSGNATYTVNLSKHTTKLNSLMLLDSVNGEKIPKKTDIIQFLKQLESQLLETKGIGTTQVKYDFETYIFSIEFHFSSIRALEKGLNSVVKSLDKGNAVSALEIKLTPAGMSRHASFKIPSQIVKQAKKNEEFINEAEWISIFRFERKIASVSGKNLKLAGNKKAVMQRLLLKDILQSTQKISTQYNFEQ